MRKSRQFQSSYQLHWWKCCERIRNINFLGLCQIRHSHWLNTISKTLLRPLKTFLKALILTSFIGEDVANGSGTSISLAVFAKLDKISALVLSSRSSETSVTSWSLVLISCPPDSLGPPALASLFSTCSNCSLASMTFCLYISSNGWAHCVSPLLTLK